MKQTSLIAIGIIAILVIGGGVSYLTYLDVKKADAPGQWDQVAQCLSDNGVKFFGAFWCPHCQNQKKTFGNSAKLLPYVECSSADGQSQLQICKDAGVSTYPTWIFPDASRLSGEQSPETLALKAGCPLPADFVQPIVATTSDSSSNAQ